MDITEEHKRLWQIKRDERECYIKHLRDLYWSAKCSNNFSLAFDILKEFRSIDAMGLMDKPAMGLMDKV